MSLQDDFKKASSEVQNLKKRPADSDLLELYSLFKQAQDGDVSGSRPGLLDLVGRKKYDAWALKKGLTKEAAMQKYITLVKSLMTKT